MKWFNVKEAELSEEDGKMKRNRVEEKDSSTTLIAGGTAVRGDIHFAGRLYVSGAVIGKISTDEGVSATLIVDEGGHIEGDVQAAHVVIAGRIDGNVMATERMEVASTARVRGDLSYKDLAVELGGMVNGRLLCMNDEDDAGNVRVFELSGDGDRDASDNA